jgi:hypothetical protein
VRRRWPDLVFINTTTHFSNRGRVRAPPCCDVTSTCEVHVLAFSLFVRSPCLVLVCPTLTCLTLIPHSSVMGACASRSRTSHACSPRKLAWCNRNYVSSVAIDERRRRAAVEPRFHHIASGRSLGPIQGPMLAASAERNPQCNRVQPTTAATAATISAATAATGVVLAARKREGACMHTCALRNLC